MTTTVHHSAATPVLEPIVGARGLALGLGASVLAGTGLAAALANLLHWSGVEGGLTVEQSVVAGAGAIGLGAIIGLALLWPASSRTAPKFGLLVVAASTSRMLVSMAAGVVMLLVGKPAAYPLFAALCAGFVLCLIVESVWAMSALRRAQLPGGRLNSSLTTGVVAR